MVWLWEMDSRVQANWGNWFYETFASIARLESIRILSVVACVWKFKLFQMDVKSAFLNEILNEEEYVEQPKGFKTLGILIMSKDLEKLSMV